MLCLSLVLYGIRIYGHLSWHKRASWHQQLELTSLVLHYKPPFQTVKVCLSPELSATQVPSFLMSFSPSQ